MPNRSRTRKGAAGDVSHLRDDIDTLRHDIVSLSRTIGEEVSDTAHKNYDRMKSRGKRAVSKMEKTVRSNPSQSVLAAFGAGLVLSALMKRG